MWFAGFAEGFVDNALRARQTSDLIAANPLGTAAGYGVNLPRDRAHTTQARGFARMQISPIHAQLSRGKFEMAVLEAMAAALLDLRRMVWDLSLFTTAEFNFVTLPAEYTTGSSIMPNKRNPDVIELLRASYASVVAARTEIEQLLSLPSGYQRDLQFSFPRARCSTAVAAGSQPWSWCPFCSRVCSGTRRRCATRSSRPCTPPTWRSSRPPPAYRFAMRIVRLLIRPARQGRGARPKQVWRLEPRPARTAICGWMRCANG